MQTKNKGFSNANIDFRAGLRLKGVDFIFLIGLGLKRELAYVAASPRTEQTLICLGCSCIFKCVVSSGVDKTNNKSVLAHMG